MKDQTKRSSDMRDEKDAAEERPVPSQAEGDLETVEEDLEQKEKQEKQRDDSSSAR